MRHLLGACIAATALLSAPVVADERVRLQDDRVIDNGLTLVAAGGYIRRNCRDEISQRKIKAFNFMLGLKNRANELGYSDDEIRAYLDNPEEKERVEGQARRYLAYYGADFEDKQTICEAAKIEIAAERGVGRYFQLR